MTASSGGDRSIATTTTTAFIHSTDCIGQLSLDLTLDAAQRSLDKQVTGASAFPGAGAGRTVAQRGAQQQHTAHTWILLDAGESTEGATPAIMAPVPPSSLDPREVRRDAVRLANAAGRTGNRTASQVAALGQSAYEHALGASPRGAQSLLPSGHLYTGARAPGSSMRPQGQGSSSPGLYLATAPPLASSNASSTLSLGTLTAPDNMRAQKQASKEKKAKIKKRKATQAQVAASALAGRSDGSYLQPVPTPSGSGMSSGRASPAARSSGDESTTRPRVTRQSSGSSNLNTVVTVVASATSGPPPAATSSRPVTPAATTEPRPSRTALAQATAGSSAQPRRRTAQSRASAAASELASQAEVRPYDLYGEMLGGSSDEDTRLPSSRRAAPPAHTSSSAVEVTSPTSSVSALQPPYVDDREAPVRIENTDPDLAAAINSTSPSQPIDIPSYPPPPFPSGPYSTRPRAPPTPPPPLRPPDPTMTAQQQQEERELERTWETYRAQWSVPSSPPPAFRSDDEDDVRRGGQSSALPPRPEVRVEEVDSEDEVGSGSDEGSVSSARRAWEDDLRNGLNLADRIAREMSRRAAKVASLRPAAADVAGTAATGGSFEGSSNASDAAPDVLEEAGQDAGAGTIGPASLGESASTTLGIFQIEDATESASAGHHPVESPGPQPAADQVPLVSVQARTQLDRTSATTVPEVQNPTIPATEAISTAPQAAETSTLRGVFSVDAGAFLQQRLRGSDVVSQEVTPVTPAPEVQQEQVLPTRADQSTQPTRTAAVVTPTTGTPVAPKSEPVSGLRRLPTVNAKRLAALEKRTRPEGQESSIASTQPSQQTGQTTKEGGSRRVASISRPGVRAPSTSSKTASNVTPSAGVSASKVPKPRVQEKYHRDALAAAERRRQLWQAPGAADKTTAAGEEPSVSSLVLPKAPRTSIQTHYRKLSGEDEGGSGSSGVFTTGGVADGDNDGLLSRASRAESNTSHEDHGPGTKDADSDSSDEQWAAEDEEFERLQAKEQAVLRMRQRAEQDESSDEEEEAPRADQRNSTHQQLQALAQLDKMVPRAPPPLALGRSRSGAAFSSSSEESSDEERRLESTGSEPDDEYLEGRRSSDFSERSVRSVDPTALAAFNYLRARTMQLTGQQPDESMESSSGPGPAARRLPVPPAQSQSPSKAHFVHNEAEDDAIAAHVFSQFSSAQKGKTPVRPADHLVFARSPVLGVTATRQETVPVAAPSAPPARPLPMPPRMGQPVFAARGQAPSTASPVAPAIPPRPSELTDSPFGPGAGGLVDRSSVGTRLKGLFGTQLEGTGSVPEVLQGETVSKIKELFDRPLAGQGQEGSNTSAKASAQQFAESPASRWSLPAAPSVRPPSLVVTTGPARLATPPVSSSLGQSAPAPPVIRMEDVKDKEAQVQAISVARSDSLRALEARMVSCSRVTDTDPQKPSALAPASPLSTSTSPSQRSFNEDRPLQSASGLSRSGAITGRSGPPPAAFFTRRFGPRPASFVNPRSGEAPRPLGRLPTITPATRHYEPTKRVVPSDSVTSASPSESGSAVGSVPGGLQAVPPLAGTPSWLAHIPSEERTQLPEPIVPLRLHAGTTRPTLPPGATASATTAASPFETSIQERRTSAASPYEGSMQERRTSAAVDEGRMLALQRRPPPPPPTMQASNTSANEHQSPSIASTMRPALGGGIASASAQDVFTRPHQVPPTRSATRPLPAIPSQATRTATPSRPESESVQSVDAVPTGTPVVEQPEVQGEALLQRARSALRPHRREPSLGITDLDLLVSQLEESNGDHYEDLTAISEFLGPARSNKPSAAEMAALSVGKVELERRRVDGEGRVKQKLSVAGVRVDRCGICLTQFRQGEECCIYPCWHIYHRACASNVLLNSRLCPTCRKDIAIES
ncbi:hypothetical protein A4X09_0g5254 [Tilletia walkeri]|uniref:RING-type domain-containing protein n=1 Tax=Tilletia walkeri TaxID=117179 RepID=A0A8X7T372_9BASI|nr:hypothetical protein A4X09_0g5254 [Tilletia walkeri]